MKSLHYSQNVKIYISIYLRSHLRKIGHEEIVRSPDVKLAYTVISRPIYAAHTAHLHVMDAPAYEPERPSVIDEKQYRYDTKHRHLASEG